jgi:bifunctional non-homologous end joining protein LigD
MQSAATPSSIATGRPPSSTSSSRLSVERIVCKRADAPYAPGNRGLWLKVKWLNWGEFVVVGWTA